ncbi:MAG: sulfatase, partial [Cytophagaceae bacterium]|nr:sulfatase [Gemmatimonadaceae bacterium]
MSSGRDFNRRGEALIVERIRAAVIVLRLGVALGVLAGALQVLVGAFRHVVSHGFIWLSQDYVWMTPVGTVVFFLAAAAPVALIALAAPGLSWARIAAFLFGALAALSLLLLVDRMHHLASLVVSLGIGTRVAAWVAPDAARRSASLGRVAILASLGLGLISAWREFSFRRAERAQIAALPAAPADAPNVLVIILDTVRAASMSFLGYSRETTPHLAALGANGAVFEQAHSTAPWTLPSHAGMFTGRYPSQLPTDWRTPLDGAAPTLAEALARRGYRTAGFAANHFYTSRESGLTRGFEHYEDYKRTPKQVLLSSSLAQTRLFWQLLQGSGVRDRLVAVAQMDLRLQVMWTSHRKLAPEATAEFLRWQEGVSGRPFLAFLNLYDAHLPYDPPAPWDSKFGTARTPLDLYDGGIAYMDDALGALFRELASRGVLDRTLVIVSSDHGEAFGEHGLHGHGNSLYRTEIHVPLVVSLPGRVPGGT